MIDYKAIYKEHEYLLDGLKAVQTAEGHLSDKALRDAAAVYNMTPNHVYETATFYSMLSVGGPVNHIIEVCGSTCCDAQKAGELIAQLRKALPDSIEIKRCECQGRCDTAPNALVDGTLVADATCEKIVDMLGGSL